MALELAHENIWFDKWRADDAERQFYENKAQCGEDNEGEVLADDHQHMVSSCVETVQVSTINIPQECEPSHIICSQEEQSEGGSGLGSLVSQIAKARQEIQNSLVSGGHSGSAGGSGASSDVLNRITKLEGENKNLSSTVSSLEQTILTLTKRLEMLECDDKTTTAPTSASPKKPVPMETEDDDDDDDVDLFGSDDEDDEAAARVREERIKAYAEKKAKKPGPIAKSSVLLDCKPWDDETDMFVMETEVRKIVMDGLVWGAAKLVPLAYGIQKLSILCTVEDEKVSIDDLSEKIQEIENYVQSVDIAAFNKV
ncbi:probable elongation factor 1-delta isoform X2 [Homarus americanus]|uniref:probable elongation factor 1-delta isoform X2 n=1 Tax=Homarus americanus TaxID=6706 RepID=UPI001C443D72|nr:probable elongation factor 1-delta isoform X2 [Homarus americanus]XP_042205220.1 probable elongation factor 1-delta isoform X2 [Homarus americanus]